MSVLLDGRLGAEDLQREVYVSVLERVNEALAVEAERWADLDAELAALQGRAPLASDLEPLSRANMHVGHRPSMIEAPIDEYPSLAVMAFRSGPSSQQAPDQMDSNTLTCSIECIVRSGPYPEDDRDGDGETVVDRRVKRTAEALHAVMIDRRQDTSSFAMYERPPIVLWGDVFVRPEEVDGVGRRWYWQGVRMEYTFDKPSVYDNLIDQ